MTNLNLPDLPAKAEAANRDEWTVEYYGDGDSLVIHYGDLKRICFMATPSESPGALAQIEANAAYIAAANPARLIPLLQWIIEVEKVLEPLAKLGDGNARDLLSTLQEIKG